MTVAPLQLVGLRCALVAVALALTLAAKPTPLQQGQLCTSAIRAAERAFDLPAGLLMAVALTETGRRIGDVVTPSPWSNQRGRRRGVARASQRSDRAHA
jgi:hypothetical protein